MLLLFGMYWFVPALSRRFRQRRLASPTSILEIEATHPLVNTDVRSGRCVNRWPSADTGTASYECRSVRARSPGRHHRRWLRRPAVREGAARPARRRRARRPPNYHLFTPLLYQVASCLLNPSEIAAPLRKVFRGAPNVRYREGDVAHVDFDGKRVHLADGASLDYDYVVLATGSATNYYGNDAIEKARARAEGSRRGVAAAQPRARVPRTRDARRPTPTNAAGCSRSASSAADRPASSTRARSPSSCGSCSRTSTPRSRRPTCASCCSKAATGCSRCSCRGLSKYARARARAARRRRAHRHARRVGRRQGRRAARRHRARRPRRSCGPRACARTTSCTTTPRAHRGRRPPARRRRRGRVRDRRRRGRARQARRRAADDRRRPRCRPAATSRATSSTAARAARSATTTRARSPRSAGAPRSARSGRSGSAGFIGWIVWLVVHLYYLIGFENRAPGAAALGLVLRAPRPARPGHPAGPTRRRTGMRTGPLSRSHSPMATRDPDHGQLRRHRHRERHRARRLLGLVVRPVPRVRPGLRAVVRAAPRHRVRQGRHRGPAASSPARSASCRSRR